MMRKLRDWYQFEWCLIFQYEAFKETEGFPALRVDGREFDSLLLLQM